MTTCAQQEHLGEYVTEGLDPAHQARIRQHVPTCPTCLEELSKLQELELNLRLLSAGPAQSPVPLRRWYLGAAAAAVLIVAAILYFARPPSDLPIVDSGSLWSAAATLQTSAPVPLNTELRVDQATSRIRLPSGTSIEAHSGARFSFSGPRDLHLFEGRLTVTAETNRGTIRVETPQGFVEALLGSYMLRVDTKSSDRHGLPLVSVQMTQGSALFVDRRQSATRLETESEGIAWDGGMRVRSFPPATLPIRPPAEPVHHETRKPERSKN